MDIDRVIANATVAFTEILEKFATGATGWYVALGVLLAIVLIDFIRAAYGAYRRSLQSRQFLLFCLSIFLWAAINIFLSLLVEDMDVFWVRVCLDAFRALTLASLCFHVWSQVSYKPVTTLHFIRYLFVPAILFVVAALAFINPSIDPNAFIGHIGLQAQVQDGIQAGLQAQVQDGIQAGIQTGMQDGTQPEFQLAEGTAIEAGIEIGQNLLSMQSLAGALFWIFSLLTIAKAYLLCFNVLYQMPKHMRHSTYRMLYAISAIAAVWLLGAVVRLCSGVQVTLTAISYIIALYAFFSAFFIANSANVIVTSREFVFANLSTIVITVSLKGNILDWNRKGYGETTPLPAPKYKEPYETYRRRILATCNGVTSSHDENIITTTMGGTEQHYLFTPHTIGYRGRNFGYLIEISEVTKSYSALRYLEEIAMYDNLTGLKNRNAYVQMIKEVVSAEHMPLGIIIGDVNNLKRINDTFGHLQGDRLLKTITIIVEKYAPEGSSVFRIGGDEIVLLVPHVTLNIIRRFLADVTAACLQVKDADFGSPSIAWGHAIMTSYSQDYNEVFRLADAIMYDSKRAHKRDNKRAGKEVSISGIIDVEPTGNAAVVATDKELNAAEGSTLAKLL
ncbi:MAG: GGDEF domain-containing protein [Coriobacteriales bacterium]|nr:GGDEF domain-containing protein [Coriobacteriales bacterium]